MYKKVYTNGGYSTVKKVGKQVELTFYDKDGEIINTQQFMPNRVTGIKNMEDYIKMIKELNYVEVKE